MAGDLSDYFDEHDSTAASEVSPTLVRDAAALSDAFLTDVDQRVLLRPRWLKTKAEIPLEFADV